ncbi:hypothetical protein ACLB2K_063774 [Fragaria x ananassa]
MGNWARSETDGGSSEVRDKWWEQRQTQSGGDTVAVGSIRLWLVDAAAVGLMLLSIGGWRGSPMGSTASRSVGRTTIEC